MSVSLYYDDVFLDHYTRGHPESPERLVAIVERLRTLDQAGLTWRPAAEPVTDEILELVHPKAFWQGLRQLSANGGGWIDADTYCTPASYGVARRAVGTSVECSVRVCEDRMPGFALVRPPGHHASANRAMGFCLMNNVAVAARGAQQLAGIDRVAIIDIDVHHGNGTQDIFLEDPTVLYCSLHQAPFYPQTGMADLTGRGAGSGTTVNVPLPAGTGGLAWLEAFDRSVAPAVGRFQPDLILVSAGFDGHVLEPFADFALSTAVYGEVATRIAGLAHETPVGASAWFLEGGYALGATAGSCAVVVEALCDRANAAQPERGPLEREHDDHVDWTASGVDR